jgi:hypothetical protein
MGYLPYIRKGFSVAFDRAPDSGIEIAEIGIGAAEIGTRMEMSARRKIRQR